MRSLIVFSLLAIGLALAPAGAADLQPRVPLGAEALLTHPDHDQRLIVKFGDVLRVRAGVDGTLRAASGLSISEIDRVTSMYDLSFTPLIRLSETTLGDLELRAAARSGVAQPDLAGMAIVVPGAGESADLVAIGEALQALSEVEFAYIQALGVEPPVDIPPVTPDLVAEQDYREANPGMTVDYAVFVGATGAGVRLSDCEYGWNADHEDLNEIDLHLEPGQTVHPDVETFQWDEHGTAVLGETSSMVNAYGCSGMAPDADVYTWPEWTLEEGFRRVTCITNAIVASDEGDVVLLEMQTTGAGGDYGPAELDPAVWTVVRTGADAGVIVVGAAGNGNQNLDSGTYASYMDRGDSGAIIVGAGTSSTAHSKLSFSTYGSRVNVQGWGHNVFTLGYGSFAQYGGDRDQRYTSGFNGTSSASPFIASACAILQSVAIAESHDPISPSIMRQLLIDTGWPQGSGGHIGPFPNMELAIETYLDGFTIGVGGAPAVASADRLMLAPNPFRVATLVRYATIDGSPIRLDVHDVAGRRVRTLLAGDLSGTSGVVRWDGRDDGGRDLAAGIYHVRMQSSSGQTSQRVLLLR